MAGALSAAAAVAAPITERVSLTMSGGQANAWSQPAVASADCRYVAFSSGASNLVAGDTNGQPDLFVRDRSLGTTTRVDVSTTGDQAQRGSLDMWSIAISADGRFVAFGSDASNLVAGDTNRSEDVFVHDMTTGTTSRVSLGKRGQFQNASYAPSISPDGRFVAFTVSPQRSGRKVYLRDQVTGTTRRVSVHNDGSWFADSQGASVSLDGRYVAFNTLTQAGWQVRTRDMVLGSVRLTSVSIHGKPGNRTSLSPAISGDGRYVVFDSTAHNLVPHDTNHSTDIFVRDRALHTTRRIDLTPSGGQASGGGTGFYDQPAISANGRYIAYSSAHRDLVPGDTNHRRDVFLHDMATGLTTRASVTTDGRQLSKGGSFPFVCAGPSVGFASLAGGAVPNDTNAAFDVFLRGPLP
jgi:Tol biopolymer transport system component